MSVPTVTPCPVPWCPDAGHHEWDTCPSGERSRFHEVKTRIEAEGVDTQKPTVVVTVAAEVFEDDDTDGPDRSVQVILDDVIDGVVVLRSREVVDEVVFALQNAADLVFGRDQIGVTELIDHDEFDAAVDEVIARAEHPQDVNRLVAAAIRLRKAAMLLD